MPWVVFELIYGRPMGLISAGKDADKAVTAKEVRPIAYWRIRVVSVPLTKYSSQLELLDGHENDIRHWHCPLDGSHR